MSVSVNMNNYNQYQPQATKKNTAKKAALALGALATVGTGVYLAKSGKGAKLAKKIKTNLEAFAIGKKIVSFFEKTGKRINEIKTKVTDSSLFKKAGEVKTNAKDKIKDLHLGEKVKDAKQKVTDSSLYKKAGEIKTNAKDKIKDLHIREKAQKALKDTKKRIADADIPGKAKNLFDQVKGFFTKKA